MELLAHGRDADVFALDGERVLRRYRHGAPPPVEAQLMIHLHQAGYPVPLVHDVSGHDMVMQRLHGPSMAEALFGGTDGLATVLADLHNRLHRLPAPDWLPRLPAAPDSLPHGPGDRIVHMDLHPENVIITETGPVVVDWTTAAAGDPARDLADLIVVMTIVDVDVAADARRRFLDEFRAAADTDPDPCLPAAITHRLANPNLRDAEAATLRDWRAALTG